MAHGPSRSFSPSFSFFFFSRAVVNWYAQLRTARKEAFLSSFFKFLFSGEQRSNRFSGKYSIVSVRWCKLLNVTVAQLPCNPILL